MAEISVKMYGPYTRKDGRQHVIFYEDGKRKTVSYPKYLLETKLGRTLLPNETCDHIDNNPLNNDLNNLQVLSRSDNTKKRNALFITKLSVFTCPICLTSFTRQIARVKGNLKQHKRGPYCSRSCAGKAGRLAQG